MGKRDLTRCFEKEERLKDDLYSFLKSADKKSELLSFIDIRMAIEVHGFYNHIDKGLIHVRAGASGGKLFMEVRPVSEELMKGIMEMGWYAYMSKAPEAETVEEIPCNIKDFRKEFTNYFDKR